METCPRCAARVAPDLEWCGQCFAALESSRSERPSLQIAMRDRADGAPAAASEFSRWRAGPTSFGPVGRGVLTIGLLLALVAGYPLSRGFILAMAGFDVPGTGYVIMYVALAVPAGLYLAGRIWKRVRVV